MTHYKDGRSAQVGDVVRGKGYNVKDKDGNLKEIIGVVVGVVPNSIACNIQVAYIVSKEVELDYANWSNLYDFYAEKGVTGCGPYGGSGNTRIMARVSLEYGECSAFEKIG